MSDRQASFPWWCLAAVALAGCGGSQPGSTLPPACTGAGCVTPPTGVCGDMQNDPQNCGACRNVCGAQACNAGACGPAATRVPLASSSLYMSGLALDASFVYFADQSTASGGVYRVPVAGGALQELSVEQGPSSPMLAGGNLLFGVNPMGNSLVRRVSLSGGAATTIASSSGAVMSIAADSASVFWTTSYTNELDQAPLAGGAAVKLSSSGSGSEAVFLDGANLYWISAGDVVSMPKAGGAVTTLVAGMDVQTMTLHAGYLYYSAWRGYNDPLTGVYRVPVAGGTPTPIATGLFAVTTLATDGTTVYFADGLNDFSILRRAPAAGGGKYVSLSGFVATPLWSALDGSWVYWNDHRSIYRIAR